MAQSGASEFISKKFTVDRRDLVYIQFVLESYEGIAIMSTLDRGQGIVQISYSASLAAEAEGLIAAIQTETTLQPLTGDRAEHAA